MTQDQIYQNIAQRTGQIFDALLLGLLLKQAGVVGGLGCGALLALGLQGLVLAEIGRASCRERV